ncbi:MAG: hypothetical protein ACTSYL_03460 [Candidatus Thorarchaeota archaeon]
MSSSLASAQSADEWYGDENIKAYITVNDINIKDASEANPITLDPEGHDTLTFKVNVTAPVPIYNLTAKVAFYYQGIKIFSYEIRQNETQEILPGTQLGFEDLEVNIGGYLSGASGGLPVDIATGIYQTSVDIYYYLQGDDYTGPPTHTISGGFYVLLPPDGIIDVVTSAAGIATTVSTVGAVTGLGNQIYTILDGLQTAHKFRSIQKKVHELRALPNLAVIGALPTLFSIFASMKMKKKKDVKETESVSEFRLKQRLREDAPAAWPKDRCPTCGRKWNEKTNICKKCHIDEEEARRRYAELLVSKVPRAIKVLGKKKALSIKKLAKKTKSNQYNAGVIGAAMVDAGLCEVTKIETPIRGFVLNIAGLAFLIITWQQLLGGATSKWQTTLTIVGGALSLAVIIALYFARKMQIEKLQAETEVKQAEAYAAAPEDTPESAPTSESIPDVSDDSSPVGTDEPEGSVEPSELEFDPTETSDDVTGGGSETIDSDGSDGSLDNNE